MASALRRIYSNVHARSSETDRGKLCGELFNSPTGSGDNVRKMALPNSSHFNSEFVTARANRHMPDDRID